MSLRRALLISALTWASATAVAQPAAELPKGPADIITGAKEAQRAKELSTSGKTAERVAADPHAGVPGAPPMPAADPHAGVPGAPPMRAGRPGAGAPSPHGAGGIGARQPPRVAPNTAVESALVPAGSISVRVVDGQERPVPRAAIRLGIMGSMDARSSVDAVADGAGQHTFGGQPTGDKQAYRVNVSHGGARFSSTPFRLPATKGFDVVIHRLETTDAADAVILYVGATSVEFAEERFKVVQQVRLINVTDRAYVFPKDGVLIPMPEGAVSFQSEKNMGHQLIEEHEGAVRITGSLEPGQATLLWGFGLPITGTEQTISLPVPWQTFSYRVLVDDAPGLSMTVDGMPAAQRRADQGRSFLVTEVRRRPDDAPFASVTIRLSGIPGPGPLRWVAVLLGLLAIGLGLVVAARGRPPLPGLSADALLQRRGALLSRAVGLERDLRGGEIGPDYHAQQMAGVTDELAIVLRGEADRRKSSAAATGDDSTR